MPLMIIGLGNPVGMYPYHERHNMGFMVMDMMAQNHGLTFRPAPSDILALTASLDNGKGENVLLVQPQTTMNRSGEAIADFLDFRRISDGSSYDDFVLIQDDVDLEPGRIRIKRGGSDGHHNGVRSVMDVLGRKADKLVKVKVGVGRPPKGTSMFDWVTGEMDDEALDGLMPGVAMAEAAVEDYVQNRSVEAIMNKYNGMSKHH